MTPKVSVIIPVYNGERFLSMAIESVTRQTTFSELELILIDDGSTDDSGKICDAYSNKFSNIVTLHCKNAGVSAARNAGIAHARGEYLTFLDSDDTYEPMFIEKLLEHGDCDLVCCDYYCKDKNEKILAGFFDRGELKSMDFDADFYKKIIRKEFYTCWNKLYKKSIIFDNKIIFPEDIKYGEDMMFVFKYLEYCKVFYFLDEALYFYNVNPYNATVVVKQSYEVGRNIFEWQTEYFKRIDLKKKMFTALQSNFVYNSVCAINSAITYNNFFTAAKTVKKIISDSTFYESYMRENYTEFKCKYDKVFFKLLKKKQWLAVVVWRKIFDLRSKLINGSSD